MKKVGPARADCLHVHVSRCLPAAGVQCPPAVAAVVIILLLLPFLSTAVVAKLTCRVVLCCVVLCCVALACLQNAKVLVVGATQSQVEQVTQADHVSTTAAFKAQGTA